MNYRKINRTKRLVEAQRDLQAERLRTTPSLLGLCERKVQELSTPQYAPTVIGGEVLPEPSGNLSLHDTLADPDTVAVDASVERTDLLERARVLELGLDLARTINAGNSMEKILAHGIAACHANAMQLLGEATYRNSSNQNHEVIALKKIGAATRLLATAQNGMETLLRIRTAGQQTITVKQIHINGGQNMIASTLTPRGKGEGGEER